MMGRRGAPVHENPLIWFNCFQCFFGRYIAHSLSILVLSIRFAAISTASDEKLTTITLGGGISYILSSAGFTCDVLIGAQLVTADGRIVEVDEEREPDLLWALRGGGGNFGVVTRFRYQATPSW